MLYSLTLAAFGTVFASELLGDRALYTICSLMMRFRAGPVLCGVVAAFMGKALGAVVMGRALASLPAAIVAGVSAAAFLGTAAVVWYRPPTGVPLVGTTPPGWTRAIPASFVAVFFSEWADAGQVTTAALVARYRAPFWIWLGATLALTAKAVLAVTIGVALRRHAPQHFLRYLACALCLTLGILSLIASLTASK